MVYMAWVQWINARAMTKLVRDRRKDLGVTCRWDWTNTHSFFACMGGFVLDHATYSTRLECPSLTMDGILYTAWHEPWLLDFSEATINDRSRADALGKILVYTQASYVILQVLARLKDSLPVTLLEVNTICHVICAFIMYAFWFEKPMDVTQTISIRPRWAENLDATYSMRLRKFTMQRTRDSHTCSVIEQEIFDHYRFETLSQLQQQQESKVPNYKLHALQTNDNTQALRWWCLKCGKQKEPATSAFSSTRSFHEDDAVRGEACWQATFTSSNSRSFSILEKPHVHTTSDSKHYLALHSQDDEMFSNYQRRYVPDHDIVYHDNYAAAISAPLDRSCPRWCKGCSFCVKSNFSLQSTIMFPLQSEWQARLSIVREVPNKFQVGTWEYEGLVLVLHGVHPTISDEDIGRRLWQSKLWSCLTTVYAVPGYVPPTAYFRRGLKLRRWRDLGFDHSISFTTSISEHRVICGVVIDMAGVERWETAFNLSCEAKGDETYDEVAIRRSIEKGSDQNLTNSINYGFDVEHARLRWANKKHNRFLAKGIPNWPQLASISDGHRWTPKVALALSTAAFGGIHALAWNVDHPTNIERILWNISSLIIAVSGAVTTPFLLLILWVHDLSRADNSHLETTELTETFYSHDSVMSSDSITLMMDAQTPTHSAIDGLLGSSSMDFLATPLLFLITWLTTAYVLARCFLIAESFVSLRALPAGAFETSTWTNFLLHW